MPVTFYAPVLFPQQGLTFDVERTGFCWSNKSILHAKEHYLFLHRNNTGYRPFIDG